MVEPDPVSGTAMRRRKWVEVVKSVAVGSWDGIVCPENADADVLIEVHEHRNGTEDTTYEYSTHCPKCGAVIHVRSKYLYRPAPRPAD